VSDIPQGEGPEPRPTDEHQANAARFRDRIKPLRWFKTTKVDVP
jgi:hypothetical protein